MFCKYCGGKIEHNGITPVVFCGYCGNKIEIATSAHKTTMTAALAATEIKTKERKKVKKSVLAGLIALLVFLAVVVVGCVLVFPIDVQVDTTSDVTTRVGYINDFRVEIQSNQPIKEIKYAVASEKPKSTESFVSAKTNGGLFRKDFCLDRLEVPPGSTNLYIAVKTWFGETIEAIELTCDIGYTSPPQEDAIVTINEGSSVIINELLVTFREGVSPKDAKEIIRRYDGTVVGEIYYLNQYQIRLETQTYDELEAVFADLTAEEEVELVSYNLLLESGPAIIPNDREYDSWDVNAPSGNNWSLECIDAPGAWDYFDDMVGVKVGVIDSSLDYNHTDIQEDLTKTNILPTDDFPNLETLAKYYDKHNDSHVCLDKECTFCGMKDHGTHVSGIIGARANNNKGVCGVNWNANLYFITGWYYTIPQEGQLRAMSSTASINYAISWLVMSGCRVVNCSFGYSKPTDTDDAERTAAAQFDQMVLRLEEAGYDFLIVKSAGNSGDVADRYALNRIMTTGENARAHTIIVGALSHTNLMGYTFYSVAGYSNYGSLVDVFAPGTDVYSTVYDGYDDMSGTSMAAPTLAGVVSLLYSMEPNLDYEEAKFIVCTQVEQNISTHARIYPVVNAHHAVEYLLRDGEVSYETETPTAGFVTGLIQDAKTEEIISSAAVVAQRVSSSEQVQAGVDEGVYYMFLEPGTYDLTFTAEGYIEEKIYGVVIEEGVVTYNILLNMVEDEDQKGTAEGRIVDAFDASSIPNAKITVYKGVNNTSGTSVATTTSDNNGYYSVRLEPGNYTLLVSADDYTTGTATVVVLPNDTKRNQDCTLTPNLKEGELRVVLTWGEFPSDLDSHMRGPTPNGGEFHTYYRNKNYMYDSVKYVNLDVDDTSSYGPETTSVYVGVDGTYTYCVHDFSNRSNRFSNGIALSGAQVKVYIGGHDKPYVFNAPNEDGTVWRVFQYKDGNITSINSMVYTEDPSDVE